VSVGASSIRTVKYWRRVPECELLIARYDELFDQSDFAAALNLLEKLGHLLHCRGGFWRDLERAAETMRITDKLPGLRRAFSDALYASQVSGGRRP
jgi:hypothetical protein